MARHSPRVNLLAALVLSAIVPLSGCTPPTVTPQAPPPVSAPVAVTMAPIPPPAAQPAQAPSPTAVPPPADAVTANKPKVALLAPLTGPNKSVGQAMLDSANMALFDVTADLALLPRDTGATPDDARAAAEKAVADGAGLVLGPVFANSAPPVRDATQGAQLSVIAFTTDANMAGGNVLVMGFLPAGQVERVVGFAKSRGLSKLAALVPDNPYGVAITGALTSIAGRLHIQPPQVMTLGRDPREQLMGLASNPPDMLLVALGGDQLQTLAPALGDYLAAHPAQLLGTGLWDEASVGQLPALVGGWYAAPPPGNFDDFVKRFQRIYNYRPPRIATLAYDSIALAASVAKGAGDNTTPFARDLLLQPNGFSGIDGAFRFLPSGLSERNLAVLAVGTSGPTVIDPPPPSFEKVGE
jgi:ABC-type branched-subunit amino acid transport system substrate-binding protein